MASPKHHGPLWYSARAESDIVFATFDNLRRIVSEKQNMSLVWPKEGLFLENGDFLFNEEYKDFQPIIMDIQTANLLVSVYDRYDSNPERQQKLKVIEQSRYKMVSLVDLVWKHSTFRAA